VFVAAGTGIRRGVSLPSRSILDIAPVLLHALGLPIPTDLEGRIPEALFEPDYLRSHPITFDAPLEKSFAAAAQSAAVDPRMEAEVVGHLRALGYME
jgi:hypothetical protein